MGMVHHTKDDPTKYIHEYRLEDRVHLGICQHATHPCGCIDYKNGKQVQCTLSKDEVWNLIKILKRHHRYMPNTKLNGAS